jgi:hypothetical protein
MFQIGPVCAARRRRSWIAVRSPPVPATGRAPLCNPVVDAALRKRVASRPAKPAAARAPVAKRRAAGGTGDDDWKEF